MSKLLNKKSKKQLKQIAIPSLIFIVIGFLMIYFFDKFKLPVNVFLFIEIINYILYLIMLVIALKRYKLRYLFLGKKFNDIVIKDVGIKEQKDYYRKTGKSILDKKGYENVKAKLLLFDFFEKMKIEDNKNNIKLFILYSLYRGSVNGDSKIAVDLLKDVDKNYVFDFISKLDTNDDFKNDIIDIINNNKDTNTIFKYEIIITNLILKELGSDYVIDITLNDNTEYDPTYHYKYVIEPFSEKYAEIYKFIYNLDHLKFIQVGTEYGVELVLTPKKQLKNYVIEKSKEDFGNDIDEYFKSNIKYSIEIRKWDRLIKLNMEGKVERKYSLILKYYTTIYPVKHLDFLIDNLKEKDEYLAVFKEFLSDELYEAIVELYNSFYKEDEFIKSKKCDELIFKESHDLYLKILDYALKIEI